MSEQICLAVLLNDTAGDELTEIPIAITGSWVKDGHRFSITKEDLDDIVSNFKKRGNGQVVVDFEHASERPEVARGGPVPAAAWIRGVSVRANDGKETLYANIEWTPQARTMVKAGEYKFFSPAIDWGATDKKTGRSKGATITSGALTNHPFLEELPAITLSESTGKEISLDQKRNAITEAVREKYKDPLASPCFGSSTWTKEVFDDYVIVESEGKLYKLDYAMDAKGNIELEEPVLVNVEYVEASEFSRRFSDEPDPRAKTVDKAGVTEAIRATYGGRDGFDAFPSVQKISHESAVFVSSGKRYRCSYTVGDTGKITIGKPQYVGTSNQKEASAMTEFFHESDPGVDPYHRDPNNDRSQRSAIREQALKRAAKSAEPGGDRTDVLDAADNEDNGSARLPILKLHRMRDGHAAVAHDGRIAGIISHEHLMEHANKHRDEHGHPTTEGHAADEVVRRTKKAMADNRNLTYSQAHQMVLASDIQLRDRYNREQRRVML